MRSIGTARAGTYTRDSAPEQKFEILKDFERCGTIKEGLAKHQLQYSVYHKWRRQLEVGVRASLKKQRPLKSADVRRLEAENRKLKEVVLNQALLITALQDKRIAGWVLQYQPKSQRRH